MGQTATVLYTSIGAGLSNGPSYRLKITVESIKQGTLADFKGVSLTSSDAGDTPDYVRVEMTNLGPKPMSTSNSDPANNVEGVDIAEQENDSLIVAGYFAPCPDTQTPNPFPVGKSFMTCLTYLVHGGITKVAYDGADRYIDSPVTWTTR